MTIRRNGWVQGIVSLLAASAVIGAITVYANQSAIEEKVAANKANATRHNRQIPALSREVGEIKTLVIANGKSLERILRKLETP